MPGIITVDLTKLDHNLASLKLMAPKALIIPVLKANAYGHGAVEVARYLSKYSFSYLALATLNEAQQIRKSGYKYPLMVFSVVEKDDVIAGLKAGFCMSVSSLAAFNALYELDSAVSAKFHIKIDTGMNRVELRADQYLTEVLGKLKGLLKLKPNLIFEAIYSHMSSSDEKDKKVNLEQYNALLHLQAQTAQVLGRRIKIHIQNSAGIANFPQFECDWVRPGISLYGIKPSAEMKMNLKPLLSWAAPIAYNMELAAGEKVSYNGIGNISKPTRVVTVLCGYGDGLWRSGAKAIIAGKVRRSIGRVCMDLTMFDLGQDALADGDRAVLIGKQDKLEITCAQVAKSNKTITHEVLCALSARNERRYIYESAK